MSTTPFGKNKPPCLDFFPLESVRLHGVAGLEVLPALEPDAALLARDDLADVFLEVLQRADATLEDLFPATEKLDPAATADLALHDATAGDDAGARDLDRGDHLDAALPDLTIRGLAQALGRALHVFGELVDDVVVADLDLGLLGSRRVGRRRLQVEDHDDGAGHAGQQKVGVAHGAHALADDLDRHDRVFDLLQRGEHGFERALRVGLDDQVQLFDLAFLGAASQVFEGDARRYVTSRLLGTPFDELGERDLARGLLRADDLEDVTRLRHLAHAGDHHWGRGRGLGDGATAIVGQRAHAAVDVAA